MFCSVCFGTIRNLINCMNSKKEGIAMETKIIQEKYILEYNSPTIP